MNINVTTKFEIGDLVRVISGELGITTKHVGKIRRVHNFMVEAYQDGPPIIYAVLALKRFPNMWTMITVNESELEKVSE